MLTVDQFKSICPNNKNPEATCSAINLILPKYDIKTKQQVAMWLGQCSHESGEFNTLKENLNYSAKGLNATWKKRFPTIEYAKLYERNPEAIANKVYCDRMGNGCEESGDGYKFRGRGCIQLTGKDNYTALSKYLNKTLDETVQYCETIAGAIESGCFFWKTNNLNRFVDKNDFIGLTEAINGGQNGLAERTAIYKKALSILK